MLSARAPCSQVCGGLRQASRNFSNARYRHHCTALPKGSIRSAAARHVVGHHNRRVTLTTLLGSTVLAMGFGTSAMAASATSPTVETILQNPNFPETFPFGPEEFQRYDETPDTSFYSQPRFVTHIDDGAIAALTKYYSQVLPPSGTEDAAILDMCSSWVSHYPKGYKLARIAARAQPSVTDFTVRDLNKEPKLPYEGNTFDVITNVVSVDYLNRPLEIFQEMHRVLKPGGLALMSFSNRCFPTKAIAVWTQTGDVDHAWIIGSYFHYSVPGGWTAPQAKDISPAGGIFSRGDPMYVAYAHKKA
ncbi:MAG: ubiquinone menaquinone biosynthesis methyltransferase [Trebouxia sp. A1-2]|nr:MAG: ubiquinone menaquinone biosynthesis methyltransferase [Trebouxia sp. A1-2]